MIFSDQGRGRKYRNFKPAEEESFQSGVHRALKGRMKIKGDIIKSDFDADWKPSS